MKRRGVFTAGGVGQVAIALGATILIAGCPDAPPPPDPLAVNAGSDQSGETGDTFTLNAGATVTGGTTPVPEWTIAGPSSPAVVNDASINGASVTINLAGVYTATLGALDANNNFAADTIQITVTDPPPPVITVNAGADKTANGGESVNLTALTSGDVPPTSFAWQLTSAGSAGTVNLSNANTQTATALFSQDAEGTFTFAVTVGDSAAPTAGIGSDSVNVVVTASPDPANTIFTLNLDNLVGTSGDDAFTAPLDLVAGAQTPTLQNADTADGMGGSDTLAAFFAGGGAVNVTPNLTGIGEVHLQNFAGGLLTLNANTSTGISHIASDNSTAAVSVTNLVGLSDAAITNNAQNLTVGFQNAATVGLADVLNLSLSNTTIAGGTFTVNSAANGIETMNVDSTGAENSVTLVNGAASLTTINTTGDQKVTLLGALPASTTALNASGQSAGGTVATAADTVFTFTGGPGDDGIDFSTGTFVTSGATADNAEGGGGNDTIGLTSAQAGAPVAAVTNVNNFENLEITDDLVDAVTASRFNLNSTVKLPQGFGAAVTLTLVAGDTLELGTTDFGTAKVDSIDDGNIAVAGAGTGDTVNVLLSDHDSGGGDDLTSTGVETLNIESNINVDGSAADGAPAANVIGGVLTMAPTIGTGTVNVTGDEDLTITGNTTVGSIDASGFTQAFTMNGISNISLSAVGGSGADRLVGSALVDSLIGGGGNDTLKGLAGNDLITGGDGNDNILFDLAAEGSDFLNDFTGGQDNVGLASGIVNFAGVVGTEAAPVELVTGDFETGRANETAIALGDALKIVRLSTSRTTAEITGGLGAAVNAYVLVHNSTTGKGELWHDADWSGAGGRTQICSFENITDLAGVTALTFTDFVEID